MAHSTGGYECTACKIQDLEHEVARLRRVLDVTKGAYWKATERANKAQKKAQENTKLEHELELAILQAQSCDSCGVKMHKTNIDLMDGERIVAHAVKYLCTCCYTELQT